MSAKITLISGIPGSGKTAACVDLLCGYAEEKRTIYLARNEKGEPSIPDLDIPHEILDDLKQWHVPGAVPDGCVIVADEVQRIWRIAAAGSKMPPDIEALETHRHRGIDFLLMTQRANGLHLGLRGLVGRHIHIRDLGVLGRRWYEMPEFSDTAKCKTWIQNRRYVLPKRVFSLYRSAAMHVDSVRVVPRAVIMLGVALVLAVVMAWYAYKSIASKVAPPAGPALTSGGSAAPGGPGAGGFGPVPGVPGVPPGPVGDLAVSAPVKAREPYAGLGVHVAGVVQREGLPPRAWFSLSVGGVHVGAVRDLDLQAAGYAWRVLAPCVVVLVFGELERRAVCDGPRPALAGPERQASGPAV